MYPFNALWGPLLLTVWNYWGKLSDVCIDIDKFTCVLNRKEIGKEAGRDCISSESAHLIVYEKGMEIRSQPSVSSVKLSSNILSCKWNMIFFFSFWPHCRACRILVPWPRIKPETLAVKGPSLNHWTTRECPGFGSWSSLALSHPFSGSRVCPIHWWLWGWFYVGMWVWRQLAWDSPLLGSAFWLHSCCKFSEAFCYQLLPGPSWWIVWCSSAPVVLVSQLPAPASY